MLADNGIVSCLAETMPTSTLPVVEEVWAHSEERLPVEMLMTVLLAACAGSNQMSKEDVMKVVKVIVYHTGEYLF